MEFIPLERYGKNKNTKKAQKAENEDVQNLKGSEDQSSNVKRIKRKPKINVVEKKNRKNINTGISVLKKKKTIPKRKHVKRKTEEEDEENEVLNEEESHDEGRGEEERHDEGRGEEESHDEGRGEEENEVNDNENENEEEVDKEGNEDNMDEAFKKKCKEMDEKKKNRLFVKLKKKIYSEAQIKELHPDIRSVIFPRKKNSRWCWAVFASEEKAARAVKKLIKNKDIIVNKPNPFEKVVQKRKEKLKTILLKKEAKKKLQKMWM